MITNYTWLEVKQHFDFAFWEFVHFEILRLWKHGSLFIPNHLNLRSVITFLGLWYQVANYSCVGISSRFLVIPQKPYHPLNLNVHGLVSWYLTISTTSGCQLLNVDSNPFKGDLSLNYGSYFYFIFYYFTVPLPPKDIYLQRTSDFAFTLAWTKPNDTIDGYVILYSPDEGINLSLSNFK